MSFHYEFGGPLGTSAMLVGLPTVCYLLVLGCSEEGDCSFTNSLTNKLMPAAAQLYSSAASGSLASSFSMQTFQTALMVIVGWFVSCLGLHLLLPGIRKEGTVIAKTEKRLKYKLNAFRVMLVSLMALAYAEYTGLIQLSWCYDNAIYLLTASLTFSLVLSIGLYVASFRSARVVVAEGGNSGNPVYDMFMGRELNPRLGPIDLKV